MKPSSPFIHALPVVALSILAYAQDRQDPGKASDAVKNPPAAAPGTARELAPTAPADREPGKTSDAVREESANERQFTGRITAVNRNDNTITVNDQTIGSQVLHIAETTKMKRGSAGASWNDLKVGESVQGMMRTDGSRAHASSIEIGK